MVSAGAAVISCFAASSSAYLAIQTVKAALAWRVIRSQRRSRPPELRSNDDLGDPYADPPWLVGDDPPSRSPLLTLLVPILSGDPGLSAKLSANLDERPPWLRFVWLIDESDIEGRRIADDVLTRRAASSSDDPPDRVAIRLCPPTSHLENPKAVKLELGLAGVTTPFVGALDDDTEAPTETIEIAIYDLDRDDRERADLVTALPSYVVGVGPSGGNLWSRLVATFVNANAATTYLPLLNFAAPVSINGMFYVTRTETLRKLGGFDAIRDRLCDDYAVARLYRDAGKSIRQIAEPVYVSTSVASCSAYVRLMHRWFVFADLLVRDQPFAMRLVLAVLLGLPPLLLWATLVAGVAATFYYVGAAMYLIAILIVRASLPVSAGRVGAEPGLSIVAEALQPFHFAHALCRRTILWRGRRILVESDGRFREIVSAKGRAA